MTNHNKTYIIMGKKSRRNKTKQTDEENRQIKITLKHNIEKHAHMAQPYMSNKDSKSLPILAARLGTTKRRQCLENSTPVPI
tara:strand:- start:111 stop:356 length:246 start_codon:yes stop_codon:yes gene_type:complete